MKKLNCLTAVVLVASVSVVQAQRGTMVFPRPPEIKQLPPPVWVDTNYQAPEWSASRVQTATTGEVFVYEQKQYGGHAALVTPEQAQGIIARFKTAYPKLGSPRFLIYVNRELVDAPSGLRLISREERIESSRSDTNASAAVKSVENNTYRADGKAPAALADKQTMRDVERIFGRPLRQAGASLVDQKVAAELIADKPIGDFVGTSDTAQSRKEREAISKIADVVIEILISSKTVTVPAIADAQTIAVPDIQATAIRLSDSKILGQASSTDATNRVPPASLPGFSVPEITEATALALMEDLTADQ